jgi:DNA ligase-1
LVETKKGIGMRFPRMVRIRDDKTPQSATTSSQVVDIFKSQSIFNLNGKKNETEFY